MIYADTVVVIPTKREPPVNTLEHYSTGEYEIIIVADPSVFAAHRKHYRREKGIRVVEGKAGLAPQIAECYRAAKRAGFKWWFRLDDDLSARTFVHRKGSYPNLDYVIGKVRICVDYTDTTLAGFMNGSNRFWMGQGFARTYGLIHGGAQLVKATNHPERYLDERLPRYEDVYRSCAHRAEKHAVGRVRFIGFDKRGSSNAVVNQSSIQLSNKRRRLATKIVLKRWPDFVTCNGTRLIHNGTVEIANWRMRRDKDYRP